MYNYLNEQGNIYNLETFGTVDGPGIRYIVFMQGCPLRCIYCHNPDSIKVGGGKKYLATELVDEILRYKVFIKSGGVTFSGGEPLFQPKFVYACTQLLKQEGINVAIDTSGCIDINSELVQKAVKSANLILLDIKSSQDELTKKITSKDNKNAFETLNFCEINNIDVWIRHVLLNDYTLSATQLTTLAKLLENFKCIKRLELLPFHKMGEHKWEDTDMSYILKDTNATTSAEVKWAAGFFKDVHYEVIYS